jgi:hypothetical protein
LSFSALFSRKICSFPSTRHVLAIACILRNLSMSNHSLPSKISLPCRPPFVGAGIVVWNQGGCPSSGMLAGPSRGTLTDPTIMKKLLPSAILAVVVSGVLTAQSFAGCCFGLIPHHGCCGCCGCGATFCVRQYNAFSPVCCGTVYCDGCCPIGPGGCGGGCGPAGCGLNYSGLPAGCCGPMGCGDGAALGSLPAADPAVGAPVDGAAPAAPLPSGPTSRLANDRPIQNATYRAASYYAPAPVRTVAPVQMQPQMMAAPSYWGN